MAEDNSDVTTRAAAIAAIIIGAMFIYRWMHPSTVLAADGDPAWDYAVRHAQNSGQPTVVFFTANWCPGCQMMHGILTDGNVQRELSMHYNFVAVDLSHPSDSVRARSSHYGVSSIPLLIRFDPDGKETARDHGMGAEQLVQWLKQGE